MAGETLVFSRHAITQMFARSISRDDVVNVIAAGETVERYEDRERSYASRLILGFRSGRPLHVVVADDRLGRRTIVVTAYGPDPALWMPDWRTRRNP